jgi:hypothetical protein
METATKMILEQCKHGSRCDPAISYTSCVAWNGECRQRRRERQRDGRRMAASFQTFGAAARGQIRTSTVADPPGQVQPIIIFSRVSRPSVPTIARHRQQPGTQVGKHTVELDGGRLVLHGRALSEARGRAVREKPEGLHVRGVLERDEGAVDTARLGQPRAEHSLAVAVAARLQRRKRGGLQFGVSSALQHISASGRSRREVAATRRHHADRRLVLGRGVGRQGP